jgi:hypothetical protein
MGSNKLIRIIVPIITAVVSIAAMVIAGFFVIRAIKDSSKDLEIEKTRIETEYSQLGENNTDPETGKTILTENYLSKDYKKFYATRKSGGALFKNVVLIFILGFVAIAVFTSIADSIVALSKGRSIKLRGIISVIIIIPVLIVGSVVFKKLINRNMPPEPGQETVKLYQIKVLDKKTHTETRRDSDGDEHTTTKYYLVLDDNGTSRQHEVPSEVYSNTGDPGFYILAQAEGNDRILDFAIYSADDYMKEN